MKNADKIQLKKLQKAEEDFCNQMNQIARAMEGNPSFTNREARSTVRQTFDGTRDAVLSILDSHDNSESSTSPEQESEETSNSVISEDTELKDKYFDNLAAHSSSCKRRPKGPAESLRYQESVSSALEAISLDESNDQASQPLLDDDTTPQEPIAEPNTSRGAFASMLRRIGQTLLGFFRRLLNRIMEAAHTVWNKVCEAFTCMFNFLGSVCHRICGREGPNGAPQYVSMAYSDFTPCMQEAMKYHTA